MQSGEYKAGQADEHGDLPIHIAVVHENLDAVEKLLSMMKVASVSIDHHNNDRQTPLHLAVIMKNRAILSSLLKAGSNPNVPDRDGYTGIHLAVKHNTELCLRTILQESKIRPDLNAKNSEGDTALRMSGFQRHHADKDMQNNSTETNQLSIASLLLQNGASVSTDVREDEVKSQPLLQESPLDLRLCSSALNSGVEYVKVDSNDDQSPSSPASTIPGPERQATEPTLFYNDSPSLPAATSCPSVMSPLLSLSTEVPKARKHVMPMCDSPPPKRQRYDASATNMFSIDKPSTDKPSVENSFTTGLGPFGPESNEYSNAIGEYAAQMKPEKPALPIGTGSEPRQPSTAASGDVSSPIDVSSSDNDCVITGGEIFSEFNSVVLGENTGPVPEPSQLSTAASGDVSSPFDIGSFDDDCFITGEDTFSGFNGVDLGEETVSESLNIIEKEEHGRKPDEQWEVPGQYWTSGDSIESGISMVPQRTESGQLVADTGGQTHEPDYAMTSELANLQRMYADSQQMQPLYGGRMTKARLKEVGSVTAEAIERLHKQFDNMPEANVEANDPSGLTVPLMPHQRHALAWLSWREEQHPPGGILADDMGLGKTLTMISLTMETQHQMKEAAPKSSEEVYPSAKPADALIKTSATLVICPASLVHQWRREVETRCERGRLRVLLYHGSKREKDIRRLTEVDIVITTYSIVSKEVGVTEEMKDKCAQEMPVTDTEPHTESAGEQCQPNAESPEARCQPILLLVQWHRIILDEAHVIKNHKSLTAMAVCRLKALHRWALTGTPIQNDLIDMYSLLKFLRCSPFDEYKLWKKQVDNKSAAGTKRLNTLVKSLLLRRTKDQKERTGESLVSLPEKRVLSHDLTLSEAERVVYDKILKQSQSVLQNYLESCEQKENGLSMNGNVTEAANNPWSQNESTALTGGSVNLIRTCQDQPGDRQNGKGQMLLLLLRMRQCCSHPSLLKEVIDPEALSTDGLGLDRAYKMADMSLHEKALPESDVTGVTTVFEAGFHSTKIQAVLEEIKEIRLTSEETAPMKSVVVSQWTAMLDIVKHHLEREGFRCCVIQGNVSAENRAELVHAFNNNPTGPEVMLLSLRAGGVGLNLIGGNHLFLIDMHWNPALEQQACDRIYRLGQTRDVTIHRFVCRDTVETRILQLQKKKLSLAENILSGVMASASKLTLDDLRLLFGLQQPPSDAAATGVSEGCSSHYYDPGASQACH